MYQKQKKKHLNKITLDYQRHKPLTDIILLSEEIERKMELHSTFECSMDILLPAFQSLENVT